MMPTTIRTSGAERSKRRQTAVVARTAATRATRVTTRSTGRLSGQGADLRVEFPAVVPAYRHLDDLDPAVRVGQRVRELGPISHPPVRNPQGGAQGREVRAVRRAEGLLEPGG